LGYDTGNVKFIHTHLDVPLEGGDQLNNMLYGEFPVHRISVNIKKIEKTGVFYYNLLFLQSLNCVHHPTAKSMKEKHQIEVIICTAHCILGWFMKKDQI
jgi:hypothetical protein